MLKIMFQKLWHKKWLALCLFIGNMLLIATVISFPLYKKAAFDRMLHEEFQNFLSEESEWPCENKFVIRLDRDRDGANMKRIENYVNNIYNDYRVTEKNTIFYYALASQELTSTMKRSDLSSLNVHLCFLTDLQDHITLQTGESFSESGYTKDGALEVLIHESTLTNYNLLLGETLEFTYLKDESGKPLRVTIAGVFDKNENKDFYWQISDTDLSNSFFIKEDLYRDLFTLEKGGKNTMTCTFINQFEFDDLFASNAAQLLQKGKYLTEESGYSHSVSGTHYVSILDSFTKKQTRIEATLRILQIPVLVLLCAFLFMLSNQMYDLEKNEISVMKSRGSSGKQIFLLYLYQSTFLAVLGALGGIFLGTVFCRLLGSTVNFLEFQLQSNLRITYTKEFLFYLAGAFLACILIMSIPAIKRSKVSIVHLKQSNATSHKALWEKLFLDLIFLGISLYGYVSFHKNTKVLTENVLQGKPLDPLLYISSSLFIIGLGLFMLRMQPLFIKLIYLIGRKIWKPASYISFMENAKNGRKQQFIMLFMILTISLGMYHSTVARTILENALENTNYLDGADFILKEVWSDNSAFLSQSNTNFAYTEPDYSKYAELTCVSSYTKVVCDTNAHIKESGSSGTDITLLGIHTKEFGMLTEMPEGLLEKAYFTYLNELAVEPNGILASRNCQTSLGYKIGDMVTYVNKDGKSVNGTIIDFYDYWPAYEPSTTQVQTDGTVETKANYQLIVNIGTLQKTFGVTPYEVWMKLKPGENPQEIYQLIKNRNLSVQKYTDKQAELSKVTKDPLLQGTNGVLTMGFLVSIILCAIGYLIYWILSISSREMQFGILRAWGMHKGELFHLLLNEQIFSGLYSVLFGIIIGKTTSKMFVPMIQTAYAASNQVLPMKLITNSADITKLYYVIGSIMLLCLFVLFLLVKKLNVTKALKLGEE